MALTLIVDRARWRAHVLATVDAFPGLVPVVKGNGYGFGRGYLADVVGAWSAAGKDIDELAVGTVHELAGLSALGPDGPRPLVLTPALARELTPGVGPAVLTVSSVRHVDEVVAAGLRPPLVVKLVSSVRRYGADVNDLPALLDAIARAGLEVHGFALHASLVGTAADHAAEAAAWAERLPGGSTIYVSHLDAAAYAELVASQPACRWRIRLGTALWHGDKSCLRLAADVVDTRVVRTGQRAGYRQVELAADGHLVLVTAGSAHGVEPLPDGRSPFHFARRRLDLLEPPHMHTSMLFVRDGEPLPQVGDQVDVQRPLITTLVDRIVEH
jgi:alanine racemase